MARGIHSGAVSDAYRDGYDAVFGDKEHVGIELLGAHVHIKKQYDDDEDDEDDYCSECYAPCCGCPVREVTHAR